MPRMFDDGALAQGERCCDVAIVGAGLAGRYVARLLDRAGLDILVLETQDRMGGRTFSDHVDEETFSEHGGQWVSSGQDHIFALAEQLGVSLFADWPEGLTVDFSSGAKQCRRTYPRDKPARSELSRWFAARRHQGCATTEPEGHQPGSHEGSESTRPMIVADARTAAVSAKKRPKSPVAGGW